MKAYIDIHVQDKKSIKEIKKMIRHKKTFPIIVETFEKKPWYKRIRDKITGRRLLVFSILSVILGVAVAIRQRQLSAKKKLNARRYPKKIYDHDPSQNDPAPNGKPKNYKGLKHIYSNTTLNDLKKHLNKGRINND